MTIKTDGIVRLYNIRHGHPRASGQSHHWEGQPFTLLEIAMLQGFSPDDVIDGKIKEIRRQIGNAVSVKPWMHHAKSIHRTLQDMDQKTEYSRCSRYDAQHTTNLLKQARIFASPRVAPSDLLKTRPLVDPNNFTVSHATPFGSAAKICRARRQRSLSGVPLGSRSLLG